MAQTVLITLTTAGSDTGPFSLLSNLDGYTVPFETNVPKLALQAGYLCITVPDGASNIRVKSDNPSCSNFITLNIVPTTTTTTSSSTTSTTSTTTSSTSTSTTTSTTTVSPCDPPPYNYYVADRYVTSTCSSDASGVLVALSTAHVATIGRYYCPCAENGYQYRLTSTSTSGPAVILSSSNTASCLTGNCFS